MHIKMKLDPKNVSLMIPNPGNLLEESEEGSCNIY
jgi:hypothetical protein